MENIEKNITHIASLIGDKSRALILWFLLDGRAYTSTELAIMANISVQSASNHLAKLVDASILKVEKQGRHRYYNFATNDAAYAIESLNTLIGLGNRNDLSSIKKVNGLTLARTCYDHIAGNLGVTLTEKMLEKGIINYLSKDSFSVTPKGEIYFRELGIHLETLKKQKRKFAFPCLDWSERKHHLAGALGSAMFQMLLDKKMIQRKNSSRIIILTSLGEKEIYKIFGE